MSFVVDVLSGKTYLEPGPNDRSDLDPLLNLWRRGQRTDELRAGFIEALTHPSPRVRAGGVMFFARMTTQREDVDLLLPLLTDQASLYEGVPEPWFGGADDLRSMLASAVARPAPLPATPPSTRSRPRPCSRDEPDGSSSPSWGSTPPGCDRTPERSSPAPPARSTPCSTTSSCVAST